jgi:hypothetical protein
MIRHTKNLLLFVAIFGIAISVYACAYSTISIIDSKHMHESPVATEHIDHAHSLTSAIIPSFIILILACTTLLLLAQKVSVLEQVLVFLWALTNTSSPPRKRFERYFHNPRSPPVC